MLVLYITNMRTLNDSSNCYLNYLKCVEWTSILTEMFKAIYKYVKLSTMISARNDISIFPLSYLTWRVLLFVQDKKSWSSYTFYGSFDFLMFVFEFRFVFWLLLLCIQVESSKYPPNSTDDMLDLIITYTTHFVATTIGRCSPKFHIQQAL